MPLRPGGRTMEAMRILFAPDKFKGSLSAAEAAEAMRRGWLRGWPGCATAIQPVADGGDGTLEAVAAAGGGVRLSATARDARGRPREVSWMWDAAARTAWIESSLVIGLAPLAAEDRQPITATSAGLGDIFRAAAEEGAERIILALGGSATNDAGCGLAAATGFRFCDAQGEAFDPLPSNLHRLARIECPDAPHFPEVLGLVDVNNPLLGPDGASRVYGPQKGAGPREVATMEEALARVAEIARRDLGAPEPSAAGAGAAGGLGYGIMAFFGGRLQPGFDTIAEITGLPQAIAQCDVVLTGEGRLDRQTAAGKAPDGVARLARHYGKQIIALAGAAPGGAGDHGAFDAVVPITDEPMDLAQAMASAGPLLEAATARVARLIRLGHDLRGGAAVFPQACPADLRGE
jgi:glycerate kinase